MKRVFKNIILLSLSIMACVALSFGLIYSSNPMVWEVVTGWTIVAMLAGFLSFVNLCKIK